MSTVIFLIATLLIIIGIQQGLFSNLYQAMQGNWSVQ